MRRGKKDGTHAAIVKALKDAGRSVLDLSGNGGGCPDLLVGWAYSKSLLMEIKNPETRHPVTANQVLWHRAWRGPPVVVVYSVEEALAATGIVSEGGERDG